LDCFCQPSVIAGLFKSSRVTLERSRLETDVLLAAAAEHAFAERPTKEAQGLPERAAGVTGIELRPKQGHHGVPAAKGVVVVGREVDEEG
jgi:hypothetical protein